MQPASTKLTCRVGVPRKSSAATLETAASKLAEAELNAEPLPRRSLKRQAGLLKLLAHIKQARLCVSQTLLRLAPDLPLNAITLE